MKTRFMQVAIEKAKEGIGKGQTPFGACIVKNNKVIAVAHNSVWKSKDATAHAEINAIRAACKKLNSIKLNGCEIYSTTEPCPMCFSAIHWAGIKKVFFGATIKDAKKAGFNELCISNERMKKSGKARIAIKGGIMAKECKELFLLWKKARKSKPY